LVPENAVRTRHARGKEEREEDGLLGGGTHQLKTDMLLLLLLFALAQAAAQCV
jgi:hypothetical protein